jgi:hypothetical protein
MQVILVKWITLGGCFVCRFRSMGDRGRVAARGSCGSASATGVFGDRHEASVRPMWTAA